MTRMEQNIANTLAFVISIVAKEKVYDVLFVKLVVFHFSFFFVRVYWCKVSVC